MGEMGGHPRDHKNPAYDSDEDGIVEASKVEQGDGSGLDADTVDGSEASELGNNIDGKTITENENGEIQADPDIRGQGWEKIAEKSNNGSNMTISLTANYRLRKVFAFVDGPDGNSMKRLDIRFNGDASSNYQYYRPSGHEVSGNDSIESVSLGSSRDTHTLQMTVQATRGYDTLADEIKESIIADFLSPTKVTVGKLSDSPKGGLSEIQFLTDDGIDSLKVVVYEGKP